MPYLVIENFSAGLDARRHPMMAPVGTLRRADNGFITRGGEVQKRRAFVPWQNLPASQTKGLAVAQGIPYVFGSVAAPAGMPPLIQYQRLQHPTGLALQDVLSWDVYNGKLYVVARFSDGSIFHFYDGVRVTDWYDGRARCTFSVVSGHGGSPASEVSSITINGVNVLGAAVSWASDAATTAQAIVDQINTFVSVPNYDASRDGVVVNIAATDPGAAANGRAVHITTANDMVVTPIDTVMSGGRDLQAATKASGSFTISGGGVVNGSFAISGGVTGAKITSVKVGTVEIMGTADVSWATSDAATASALAANINAFASVPDYTAAASGNVVTITPVAGGSAANGLTLDVTTTGTISITPDPTTMTFGKITSVKVGATEILGAPVTWATTNAAMATAVAAQINAFSVDYDATASGATVTVIAAATGTDANGKQITVTTAGVLTVAPNPVTMAGGQSAQYSPGSFVKTVQTKMYSLSGSLMHFSGVEQPTEWADAIGSGFINMANEDGQSQQLVAMERYYNKLAVFARHNVQIWTVDVDPAKNSQSQTLRNTGLIAANSVEQVGDNDVFYLSDSGVRSLRARDSSTAAAVNDIGTPVDELIVERVAEIGPAAVSEACSVIEPISGRYWLVLGDRVYVFSQFPGSKVQAWSTFSPGFTISDMIVMGNTVVARSGDVLYRYGGASGDEYDISLCEVDLPLLYMEKPAHFKTFSAIDVVCEGTWRVYAGFEPLRLDAMELIAEINSSTPSMQRISLAGFGTHANIRFQSDNAAVARLSSFMLHYELADAG